jgi:hypothetical protein
MQIPIIGSFASLQNLTDENIVDHSLTDDNIWIILNFRKLVLLVCQLHSIPESGILCTGYICYPVQS